MINEQFAILASVITLIGGFGYLLDTVKGKIQPNKVSWFLWSLAPFIAFAAQVKQGVGLQSWLTFSFGFVPIVVFIASFTNRKSYWKIEVFDIICGALSVLGLLLWYITRVGNVAILFSIMADGLATLPTLKKAWIEPSSESANVYIANTMSAFITLLTVKQWNFQTYGFSLYIFVFIGLLAMVIQFRLGYLFGKNNRTH